ncbi:MAG TPA: 1-acyl-sn-glycerol-3-phosphate acyltransferase [Syntrophaceae bacterium]|nr:1-acyl-sn-glycerol-3-phosphate acyltransferase [Syntrophaceae bacterium]
MIRSLYVLLCLIPLTAILGTLAILTAIFDRSGNIIHHYGKWWAKCILWASGVRVEVYGLENIGSNQGYILAANHQSYYDILALLGYLPVQFRFLAKKELFRIPIFGWAMYSAGHIPIDRSRPQKALKSLETAALRVPDGTSIIIFPEGTRSPDGKVKSFKRGGFVLAIQSRRPVVPVAIDGGYKILPRGSLKVRSGKIKVVIGEPIDSKPYSINQKGELMQKVRKMVVENFNRIRHEKKYVKEKSDNY